jgi:hypothetical protein
VLAAVFLWREFVARERTSKADALSFLLTYLIVEQGRSIEVDQLHLFRLNSLAQRAADEINATEGAIPHEIIEAVAAEYLAEA